MIEQITSLGTNLQLEIDRLNRTSDVQYEMVPGSYQSARQGGGGFIYSASIRPQTVRETKVVQHAVLTGLNNNLIDGWQIVPNSIQKISSWYTAVIEREVIVKKEPSENSD